MRATYAENISAFDIRLPESIIPKLATCIISIFWLVSVTQQAGLSNHVDRFFIGGKTSIYKIWDREIFSTVSN